MTEEEWQESYSVDEMLKQVATNLPSDRKLRLFAIACIQASSFDPFVMEECEVVERYADGLANLEELQWVFGFPDNIDEEDVPALGLESLAIDDVRSIANTAAWMAARKVTTYNAYQIAKKSAQVGQADLVRCIFNDPFRPAPVLSPSLLAPAITSLAYVIYHERQFDRLPELASVLEEAGCQEQDLLGHLRSQGPHVKGCWGLDHVLGRN